MDKSPKCQESNHGSLEFVCPFQVKDSVAIPMWKRPEQEVRFFQSGQGGGVYTYSTKIHRYPAKHSIG